MGRRRFPPKMSGLLLIDKPQGLTSHDVVQQVRRRLGERRIGHTGTLDPMATGLLVLTVGYATRLATYVEVSEKRYQGTVYLGRATTTFDAEGDTTEQQDVPQDCAARLNDVIESLHGEIEQAVPMYSAVKVDGERLYKKARRGETVELPTRKVTIKSLQATRVDLPRIDLDVTVSKGTYIRSLAVQIGDGLGLPSHLCGLRRTAVGRFQVADAIPIEDVSEDHLLKSSEAVAHLEQLVVSEEGCRNISHGRALVPDQLVDALNTQIEAGEMVRLLDGSGHLCAVATVESAMGEWKPGVPVLRYACVLNSADQVR
jgi:tRNA pseudouridine55 synthase